MSKAVPRVRAVLVSLAAMSCAGDRAIVDPPPALLVATTITVSPERTLLAAVGATVRLSAEVRDQNGAVMGGATVRWSSGNAAIVSVDGSGLATAVANGTATITATSGSAAGTATIVVAANSDRAVLTALFEATNGPKWANNENWLSELPLGEWYGVTTNSNGRVRGLDLAGEQVDGDVRPHNLEGEIPPQLGQLTELEYLYLAYNSLTGSIPPELGHLPNLRQLWLLGNQLTEEIPPELGQLTRLEYLHLGSNDLVGSIPPELSQLSNLESLYLYSNNLTGEIPPELGRLSGLEDLSLSGNDLTGGIPSQLGRLAALEYLSLGSNDLTGNIPAALARLGNLESLYLYSNDLTGEIPPELGRLSGLEFLSLSRNDLTGEIPRELGQLSRLESLYLYSNDLTGVIPPALARLTRLETLELQSNRLSGALPRGFLTLELETLDLEESGVCIPGTRPFVDWSDRIESFDGPFCGEGDRSVLESLLRTAGGESWTRSEGWSDAPVLSEWHGVEADSLGRVTSLCTGAGFLDKGTP